MLMSSTRTAIGSPPNRPWCSSSTVGALDEAELEQPALQLGRRQAGRRRARHVERDDAAAKAHAGVAQCYG